MARPATGYARSGDVNIAYQVFGPGEVDLVMVPGWVSHLEFGWQGPWYDAYLERLARFAGDPLRQAGHRDDRVAVGSLEERISALVVYGSFARMTATPDYPIGVPSEQWREQTRFTEANWTVVRIAEWLPNTLGRAGGRRPLPVGRRRRSAGRRDRAVRYR